MKPSLRTPQADDDDAAAAGAARNPDDEDDGGAGRKRVTLLVNVWLNHLPNSAERPGGFLYV